mmetsp:Transcript_29073/g.70122  ORF Transcript_29073/g.70122 Transcript_29073/m.70122 type:complete len:489 (+) Transcript_29073:120-1586(+)
MVVSSFMAAFRWWTFCVMILMGSTTTMTSVVDGFDLKKSSSSSKAPSPPSALKSSCHSKTSNLVSIHHQSRRQVLGSLVASFTAASTLPTNAAMAATAATAATPQQQQQQQTSSSKTTTTSGEEFQAYSIIPDSSKSLNPSLKSVKRTPLVKKLAALDNTNGGALWLGEHHNSFKDHNLQKELIEAIHEERSIATSKNNESRPMAIGLEQVQVQFQPVLDNFIGGKISLDDLFQQTQWEKRWFWDFNNYAPIFELAQELQIPLIALNVNSEDFADVQQGGLAALPPKTLRRYIKDPQGFAAFALQNEFKDYIDYVISPSYDMHQRMGLLKTTMSGIRLDNDIPYKNFLTGRLLWDESMATNAHSWVKENPGGLIVGLVGGDHVKFKDGIPGRFMRLGGAWTAEDGNKDKKKSQAMSSTSVILNPTLIDTRPAGSMVGVAEADSSQHPERLALQLRYVKAGVTRADVEVRRLPENTGGVLPLADYIVVG